MDPYFRRPATFPMELSNSSGTSPRSGNISFKITPLGTRAPAKPKPVGDMFSDQSLRDNFFIIANHMRKEEILTDVVLLVENRKYPAHKCILSGNSDYFITLFNGPLANTEQLIDLHGISSDVMENILEYMYTGIVYISEDNVYSLLDASCFFLLQTLREKCVRFLKESLDTENCLHLFCVGKKFSLTNLISISLEFISAIFMELSSHEDFQYLSYDELIHIVSSENLNISSEDEVLETVLLWINIEPEKRKKYLPTILRNIHLPFVSDLYLQRLLCENVFQNTPDIPDLIKLALSCSRQYWSNETYDNQIPNIWCYPRKCIQGIPSILALGGPSLHLFNSELNQWGEVAKCKPRHCAAMEVIGSNVYVFGGSLEWRRMSSGEVYNTETNTWCRIASMSTPRSNFGLLHLDGKLYAVGGFDGNLPLRSAEIYDPVLDKWSSLPDMNHSRDGACEVTDSERIYVIGGYDGSKYLKSIDCYDPGTNSWSTEEVPPIAEKRQNAMSAYWDSHIYVIGGYYDDTYHTSVEVLDLETNVWSFVSPSPEPSHHAGASAMNGHIFVCGGWSGQRPVDTVNVYSIEHDSWSSVASLPVPVMIRSTAINFPRKAMLDLFTCLSEDTTDESGNKRLHSAISSLTVSSTSSSTESSP